jgi:hypothetical protein
MADMDGVESSAEDPDFFQLKVPPFEKNRDPETGTGGNGEWGNKACTSLYETVNRGNGESVKKTIAVN